MLLKDCQYWLDHELIIAADCVHFDASWQFSAAGVLLHITLQFVDLSQ